MTPRVTTAAPSLTLDEWKRIDGACDRFEAAWRAGERPDLAAAWAGADVPASARGPLLRELLALELELRREGGDAPDMAEYAARFPDHRELIEGLSRPGMTAAFATGRREGGGGHRASPDTARGTGGPDADLPRADLGDAALESLRVAGYEIRGELGRGGMGVVYLARKVALNRPCALKMILAGEHAGRVAAARFRVEAEAIARLRHPGIVQVYHVGEADGLPFLELEYMPGGSLEKAIHGTPRPAARAAALLEPLALAVAEAHRRGIVHRDLKPANILLDPDGQPKVADFGLAKIVDSQGGLTRTDLVLGTPSYMAPEQAAGDARGVGPTTDVYALGAILYELVTGRPPFKAASSLETLELVRSSEPVPPSRLVPGLPRDVETICLKCLQKEPTRRYATAEALAEDLRRYRLGEPIVARPAPSWERLGKWVRRRPTTAAVAALGAAALVLMIGGAWYYNARLSEALVQARAAERDAIRQRGLAMKAFDQLVYQVQAKLGRGQATRALRTSLLDTAIAGLGEIAQDDQTSASDLDRAVAHQKLGDIYRQVGRIPEARRAYERSIQLAEGLRGDGPRHTEIVQCLSNGYQQMGSMTMEDNRPEEALTGLRHAADLAESLADLPETRKTRFDAYLKLGKAYHWLKRLDEARSSYLRAEGLARPWLAAEPDAPAPHDALARSLIELADVDNLRGDPSAARARYGEAIALLRKRIATDDDEESKLSLLVALNNCATLEFERGNRSVARPIFRESLAVHDGLVASDPENVEKQLNRIIARFNCIFIDRDDGHYEEAIDLIRPTLTLLESLKRQGKLEGKPMFAVEMIDRLNEALAYCQVAPRALQDLAFARSQAHRLACPLLYLRLKTLLDRGDWPGLAATVEALCALPTRDRDDLLRQASACGKCVKLLQSASHPASGPGIEALRRRLGDCGIAALSSAVAQGFRDLGRLEADASFEPLRRLPEFPALAGRMKGPQDSSGNPGGK